MRGMRKRRLERLEKLLLKKSEPWRDPYDLCMSLLAELDAEAGGRPFSWIPRPEVELAPEAEERVAVAWRDSDRIAEPLAAEAAENNIDPFNENPVSVPQAERTRVDFPFYARCLVSLRSS